MPKSRDYTSQDVARDIAAVKDGLPYRDASEIYNVPAFTLERKYKNLKDLFQCHVNKTIS